MCVLGADSSRLLLPACHFLGDQSSQVLHSPQKRPFLRSGMLHSERATLIQGARRSKRLIYVVHVNHCFMCIRHIENDQLTSFLASHPQKDFSFISLKHTYIKFLPHCTLNLGYRLLRSDSSCRCQSNGCSGHSSNVWFLLLFNIFLSF